MDSSLFPLASVMAAYNELPKSMQKLIDPLIPTLNCASGPRCLSAVVVTFRGETMGACLEELVGPTRSFTTGHMLTETGFNDVIASVCKLLPGAAVWVAPNVFVNMHDEDTKVLATRSLQVCLLAYLMDVHWVLEQRWTAGHCCHELYTEPRQLQL
jgi:hypothetical protein